MEDAKTDKLDIVLDGLRHIEGELFGGAKMVSIEFCYDESGCFQSQDREILFSTVNTSTDTLVVNGQPHRRTGGPDLPRDTIT